MKSPGEFYLLGREEFSKKGDKKILKVLEGEGFVKNIAEIIINSSTSPREKKDAIKNLIEPEPESKNNEWLSILETLPKNIQKKARMILYYLLKKVDVDENGAITYPDGSKGSALPDALRYFTLGNQFTPYIPSDILKLSEILYESKTPMSAFSPDKYPQNILSSFTIPSSKYIWM